MYLTTAFSNDGIHPWQKNTHYVSEDSLSTHEMLKQLNIKIQIYNTIHQNNLSSNPRKHGIEGNKTHNSKKMNLFHLKWLLSIKHNCKSTNT
jgi:hypothetical protein